MIKTLVEQLVKEAKNVPQWGASNLTEEQIVELTKLTDIAMFKTAGPEACQGVA